MDSVFGAVVAGIILFPWSLVGLTVIGYLRSRRGRRNG